MKNKFITVKEAVAMVKDGDFVMVGEGMKDAYLYIGAKERPDGGREVFVSGLNLGCGTVEANFLLGELLRWAAQRR